jgi:nucleoside-diphosphate-sugar epimerase
VVVVVVVVRACGFVGRAVARRLLEAVLKDFVEIAILDGRMARPEC